MLICKSPYFFSFGTEEIWTRPRIRFSSPTIPQQPPSTTTSSKPATTTYTPNKSRRGRRYTHFPTKSEIFLVSTVQTLDNLSVWFVIISVIKWQKKLWSKRWWWMNVSENNFSCSWQLQWKQILKKSHKCKILRVSYHQMNRLRRKKSFAIHELVAYFYHYY